MFKVIVNAAYMIMLNWEIYECHHQSSLSLTLMSKYRFIPCRRVILETRDPLLGACNSHNKQMHRHFYIFIFGYFSREIGQFQST